MLSNPRAPAASLLSRWPIHGYAIVCLGDCIADRDGQMPAALHNPADWAYFQKELDASHAVVLGRLSHQTTPNRKNRLRIVLSRSVADLERRQGAWWWNPEGMELSAMLAAAVPGGGRIAVPGGQGVFDYFLNVGYAAFHLSRVHTVRIAEGITVFSDIGQGWPAEASLAASGHVPRSVSMLDRDNQVSLTLWTSRQVGTGEV